MLQLNRTADKSAAVAVFSATTAALNGTVPPEVQHALLMHRWGTTVQHYHGLQADAHGQCQCNSSQPFAIMQDVAASIQPKIQKYLNDSSNNGTVTVDVQYAQLPPFTVGCASSKTYVAARFVPSYVQWQYARASDAKWQPHHRACAVPALTTPWLAC